MASGQDIVFRALCRDTGLPEPEVEGEERRYVEAPKAHICDGGDCGLEPCAETPAHREPGHARTVRPPRAALRSEAQGEGWQVTEPARDIVRREMPETRATVREAIRAARRGEGGGE